MERIKKGKNTPRQKNDEGRETWEILKQGQAKQTKTFQNNKRKFYKQVGGLGLV